MAGSLTPVPAPASSLAQRALIALVRAYRLLLSPWLGSACRFEPTCSRYSIEALERHGALAGSYLTVHRLMRCHPFCAGGHDGVPEQPPGLFTRWANLDSGAAPASSPSRPSSKASS